MNISRRNPRSDNVLVIRLPSNDDVAIVFLKFKEIFDRRTIPQDLPAEIYADQFVNEMINTALAHSLAMEPRYAPFIQWNNAIISFFLHPEDAERALDEAPAEIPPRPQRCNANTESGYSRLLSVFVQEYKELRDLFVQEIQLQRRMTVVHVMYSDS